VLGFRYPKVGSFDMLSCGNGQGPGLCDPSFRPLLQERKEGLCCSLLCLKTGLVKGNTGPSLGLMCVPAEDKIMSASHPFKLQRQPLQVHFWLLDFSPMPAPLKSPTRPCDCPLVTSPLSPQHPSNPSEGEGAFPALQNGWRWGWVGKTWRRESLI
jgi:hypothetical protein